MIENVVNKIRCHSRENKLNVLLTLLKAAPDDKILEVGVTNQEYSPTDNFFIKNYPYPKKIVVLGFGDLLEFRRNYPEIPVISYDGKVFPFRDRQFDIVHANAVIEHVGPFEAQEIFLKEMVRVSKRGMISTPNKFFPIELHTRVPLLHWVGKKGFDIFLQVIGKRWAAREYMFLLGFRELSLLAKRAGLEDFRIIRNRFLGFTMTFLLIW
jgi:hypothetical protein